jgi:5-methylcytosine-specific restriction endonuclease McrA
MDRLDLDRFTIDHVYRLYTNRSLNLKPTFQRERVWGDEERYALIESVREEYPIGLLMWNTVEHVDSEGVKVEKFDVVDGQQRLRTVFEYIEGKESWTKTKKIEGFESFDNLSEARKARFWSYRVPVAAMKGFEQDEVEDCYQRLQKGKPLKIGEKLKATSSSEFHDFAKEVSRHRIFDLASKRLKTRDGHWTLSVVFLKSIYTKNPFARQEYKNLVEFLRGRANEANAKRAVEKVRRILNLETKVFELAIHADPNFVKFVGTARSVKWLFVGLAKLEGSYTTLGREHLMADGVLNYYRLIAQENSEEWKNYVNTGRTGRIDTDEVRRCLVDLLNQIVLSGKIEPKDARRRFGTEMRELIFKNSNGRCQLCGIPISPDNFHADHLRPHAQGGPTSVSNGRALCTKCNFEKGSTWKELFTDSDSDSTAD